MGSGVITVAIFVVVLKAGPRLLFFPTMSELLDDNAVLSLTAYAPVVCAFAYSFLTKANFLKFFNSFSERNG